MLHMIGLHLGFQTCSEIIIHIDLIFHWLRVKPSVQHEGNCDVLYITLVKLNLVFDNDFFL